MNYLLIHSHPEKLVLNQLQRDLLFSTGKLLGIVESQLGSLQQEMFERYSVRPLHLILWGVEDRYGVATGPGIEVLAAKSWGDCHGFCQGLRPHECTLTRGDGPPSTITHWCPPGTCNGANLGNPSEVCVS